MFKLVLENHKIKREWTQVKLHGSSSSYARKYALNGLYEIDDNKDADSMDNTEPKTKLKTPEDKSKKDLPSEDKISVAELATIKGMLTPEREPKLLKYFKVEKLEDLTKHDYVEALDILNK